MSGEERTVRQEARDLRGKRLTLIGGVAIGVFGAAVWVNAQLLRSRLGTVSDTPALPVPRSGETVQGISQGMIEEGAPGLDRARAARQHLQSYGWADEARGIAHIPIDQAIDWVLEDVRDGGMARLGAPSVDSDEDLGDAGGAGRDAAAADATLAPSTPAPDAGGGP